MKGFTLFFALLVSSLALSVGLAIFDLTIRELDLSATVTQSEYAIYAADTGAECALYWDQHYSGSTSAFATSTYAGAPGGSNVDCNGIDVTTSSWSIAQNAGAGAATTTFKLTFLPQPYCATITVAKVGTPAATTVVSHGYNSCTPGTLQLERALQVSY